jgi:fatty-acyl-CoA synthase
VPMSATVSEQVRASHAGGSSPAKAWLRALELTAPIGKNPSRILSTVIEEAAETYAEAPALLSDGECMSYRALAGRSNQYTRWALKQDLGRGDTVCLIMANRPEYMAIWLGITRAGCAVALVNTNLTGHSLAHSLNIVAPKLIIVAAEMIDRLRTALPDVAGTATIWIHGEGCCEFPQIDENIQQYSSEPLRENERRQVTIEDRALNIYTSGTTGLPKAANVSHARLMQWSHWFAGMLEIGPGDRLYNCLPMYHSVGGVLATGAVLASGGSVVIREGFSASQFLSDIVRWECTLFQYIGELCRYLLHTRRSRMETQHRIRACCGNGLRPDIWEAFKSRFHIPRILEFYASTEGNVSLFNLEGKPGAIGRIPPYLAHRFPSALVRFDMEKDEPERDDTGFCSRCAPNETGEAIGRILEEPPNVGTRFEGYTSDQASARKILHDVFEEGDSWFRTGDLMRRDEQGYFYFVDRVGDTFRWKGENSSTAEVEAVSSAFPGVMEANVYGVSIPYADGRACMAALVTNERWDLAAFRANLLHHLPVYAQPIFLRICHKMEMTATFKFTKNVLAHEGYDPASTVDEIYFHDRELGAFVRLTTELYERILTGEIRL